MTAVTPPPAPKVPDALVLHRGPVMEGTSWQFLYRLRGDPVPPGDPLFDEKESIQVRIRPSVDVTSHWVWFPSGSDFVFPEHFNKYGGPEALAELVAETLTRGNLRAYAKWLAARYAVRTEETMLRASGLGPGQP